MLKKDALLVYLQRRLFLLFYRATALQRGNSFPSCAWRNILFRTRFSWFDHIFTTNSWKNRTIFIVFSDKILYFVPLFSNCALYFSHSCTIAFFCIVHSEKLIVKIDIYIQPYRFSLARHISFSASPISPSTPIDFPAISEGI